MGNPIQFFDHLLSTGQIAELKKDFFDEAEQIHLIKPGARLLDINYSEEFFVYTENVIIDLNGQKVTSSIRRKVEFKNELIKILSGEYNKSKSLIDETILDLPTVGKAKLRIQLWLDQLTSLLNKSKQGVFAQYEMCSYPLKSLIKYFYSNYESFCPFPSSTMKEIIEEDSDPQKEFEKTWELSPEFFSEVLDLSDENGNLLFDTGENAKAKVLQIAGGAFKNLVYPIDFTWSQNATYYLLNQIRTYYNFKIRDLVNCPHIKFKGKIVNEGAFSKGSNAFGKNPSKLRKKIDDLIEKHRIAVD